jgi:hypothetical protein
MTSNNFSVISNYTSGIRTSADLNPKGLQTLTLELDSAGVPISVAHSTIIHNPNQQIKFPLTTPYTYATIKDISHIEGDTADRLLITYVDGDREIIPPVFGAELVVNGTFDTDTGWSKDAGWSISGGEARSDGTQTTDSLLLSANQIVTTAGEQYQISFDMMSISSGHVRISVGGHETNNFTTLGRHTWVISSVGGIWYLDVIASADFVGSVDNLSFRKVTN